MVTKRIVCQGCSKEFDAQRSDAKWCKECRNKNGVRYRTAYEQAKKRLCPACGEPMGRKAKRCHPCDNKSRVGLHLGDRNPAWKGGRHKRKQDGYIEVRINGQRILEHRYIWEQTHGTLPGNWIVHHLNGIRDDNRRENLVAMSRRDHHRGTYGPWEARIRQLEE